MATYRDLWTQVLAEISDPNQLTIDNTLLVQITELCLFIVQVVLRAQPKEVSITYPSDVILSAFEFVPVFNVHSLVNDSTQVALDDFILPLALRDTDGRELSRGRLDAIRALTNLWLTDDVPVDYYFIMSNLLCVRQRPTADTPLQLTYINYIAVDNLEEEWPLEEEHIHPTQHLMRMFIAIRLGQYRAASEYFKRFTVYGNQ